MPAAATDFFGPRNAGAIYGTMIVGWSIGGVLGLVATAAIADATGGYTVAFIVIAGMLLASTALPLTTGTVTLPRNQKWRITMRRQIGVALGIALTCALFTAADPAGAGGSTDSRPGTDTRVFTECSGHCLGETPAAQAVEPPRDVRPVVRTETERQPATAADELAGTPGPLTSR